MRFIHESWVSVEKLIVLFGSMSGSVTEQAALRLLEDRVGANHADFKYLQEEVPRAIKDALVGIERVTKIVQAMKEFSHPRSKEKHLTDINSAIRTTVTLARNEWQYVADLQMEISDDVGRVGRVGRVSCYAGEFNQVILNLVVNAAQAIPEKTTQEKGKGKSYSERPGMISGSKSLFRIFRILVAEYPRQS
jgi:signal transduction histidine kinase